MKIGLGWLSALLLGTAALSIAARVFANQFLGLGIELPFATNTFLGRIGFAGFFFVGYLILLGWIPLLLMAYFECCGSEAEIGIEVR